MSSKYVKIIDSTPMKLYILGMRSWDIYVCIYECRLSKYVGTYVYIGILYICTYNKQ